MKESYNNPFLDEYSGVPNNGSSMLLGGGLGAGAGAGLGALFAQLYGIPKVAPTVATSVLGGLFGSHFGRKVAQNKRFIDRRVEYGQMPHSSQMQTLQDFASHLDSKTGDHSFNTWLQQDPEGFKQFMLKNM